MKELVLELNNVATGSKVFEGDIMDLKDEKNIDKFDKLLIYESWDQECLINYRLYTKNPKLTYDGALKVFESSLIREEPRLKNFKLVGSKWTEKTISETTFIK